MNDKFCLYKLSFHTTQLLAIVMKYLTSNFAKLDPWTYNFFKKMSYWTSNFNSKNIIQKGLFLFTVIRLGHVAPKLKKKISSHCRNPSLLRHTVSKDYFEARCCIFSASNHKYFPYVKCNLQCVVSREKTIFCVEANHHYESWSYVKCK